MLSHFLLSEVFAFLLVFCRLGSALMLMPGFGETYVSANIRLMLALAFSLVLAPVVPNLPAVPITVFSLVSVVSGEILIGLFFGALARLLISGVHMASMIIAYQSSLASAVVPDVNQNQGQGTSLTNLLGVTVVVLLFVTDLHHLILRSLVDSYSLFLPGHFPMVDDFAQHAMRTMSATFRVSMQLAAPHIVIGTIMYLGAGIIARLMPNMQIFFILMAPQLLLSFMVLMVAFSSIMMWYLDYFKDSLMGFLTP